MAGRGRGRRSDAGQSSGSHPDGVYMSADQFMELFRSTQPPVLPRVSPPRKSAFARQCSDFSHLGGKPFKGSESVLEVQAWLRTCERIFSRMDLSDHDRFLVTSNLLQECALDWYELLVAEIDESTLSWTQFRGRFELKFVPESEKVLLTRRFLELKQGKSSVSEYVASFEALSKYGLEFISTSYKKNLKFVSGLKKYLKKSLLLQLKLSFEELVDSALHLETIEKECDSDVDVEVSKNPNKRPFPIQKKPFPSKKKKTGGPSSQPQSSGTPFVRKCFNCGSPDHIIRACPKPLFCRYCKREGHRSSTCPIAPNNSSSGKLNVANASGGPSQSKGISPSILEGSILFYDHSIRVLFDTGASHSFVSKKLVDDLSLDVSCMVTSLRIANPIGGSATLSLLCDDVEIVLCGFSFHANMHVISCLGFDMILGMDWLVRYDARIICSERILYLRHPDSPTQLSLILRDVDNSEMAFYSLDS